MSDWTRDAEEVAAKRGLVIDRPKSNELFIDIDDAASLRVFHATVGILGALVTAFDRKPSPSGREGRFHIRVTLSRPVTGDIERIALQALLGSDRLHEVLSWRAVQAGQRDVTLFFEKPITTKEVTDHDQAF